VLVDLSSSLRHRAGHLPGARWCVRSRLIDSLADVDKSATIILAASELPLSNLAAVDLIAAGYTNVSVFGGELSDWTEQGGELETGITHPLTEVNDVWFKPYDHDGQQSRRMQEYLTWEVGLVEQVNNEGLAKFRRFDSSGPAQ
jgi:3-mercaptopyruvate sulfurtransferase SseA